MSLAKHTDQALLFNSSFNESYSLKLPVVTQDNTRHQALMLAMKPLAHDKQVL